MPKTQQLLLAPVYGLKLGRPAVNEEVKLGRVTFISTAKISKVRSRLGLKNTVAYYRGKLGQLGDQLFANADTYACIPTNRESGDKDYSAELNEIRNAFWMLASSFFSFQFRQNAALALRRIPTSKQDLSVFDRSSDAFKVHFAWVGPHQPNHANAHWNKLSAKYHFENLARIVNGKINVHPKWKRTLVRASILAGQSFLARHVAEAFANDMYAIETLLAKRGDKFPDALVDRLVALFGWMTGEHPDRWKSITSRLYELRCGYVHDGNAGDITGMDLFEADTLLRNLLANLCRTTKWITSKDDVAKLAAEYSARRLLGLKPIRRAKITYHRLVVTQSVEKKINDVASWAL